MKRTFLLVAVLWLCTVKPRLDKLCLLKLHLPVFNGLAEAGFCMYETPDLFLFSHHHSLKCAGTNAFCSNTLDDLQLGTWVAAGEQNSSFLLNSGAVPAELLARGNSDTSSCLEYQKLYFQGHLNVFLPFLLSFFFLSFFLYSI